MGVADPAELVRYAARVGAGLAPALGSVVDPAELAPALGSQADPAEPARYAAMVGAGLAPALGNEETAAGEPLQIAASDEHTELSQEEETQLRKLRRRVDSLRSRLKSLGGSDPDAPRQYEETRTRFEFLTAQIADMDSAALHLRTIIAQLDATMARQFESTFEAVNARFQEHFTTLFNGGHARLELLAPKSEDDGEAPVEASSMPAGVEVIVQPPGKKVQDLSLLSGGERALVSAALLFALLEINPPPFCLLDEVDAALDAANVMRFCQILKLLAEQTQFIVITHNQVTMTHADVIYGVEMGGESYSRVVSLRLAEVTSAR
jgi:chromosome segregation protein